MPTLAPSYIAALATLVVGIATLWGKQIDIVNVQTVLEAVVVIGGPLLIMLRQWWTGRSTVYGTRPN